MELVPSLSRGETPEQMDRPEHLDVLMGSQEIDHEKAISHPKTSHLKD